MDSSAYQSKTHQKTQTRTCYLNRSTVYGNTFIFKKSIDIIILILFFLLSNQSYSQCNLLCNTDFEDNQITSSFIITDASNVPCWGTTAADNRIEVWRSGFLGVPSYSGNQFVELNANLVSTLYQNFSTLPGASLTISFAHRGRSGVDVMSVSIGPVGGPYTTLGNYSDGNTAWGYYSVAYVVPVGMGNNYSLRFNSISSVGDGSFGNFLDAISIDLPQTVIPTFTLVPAICSGENLSALPTTSNNGITGTWAPALNNTTTTTYTFAPNNSLPGQCVTTTNLTITVNPNITPSFAPVPAICSGANLSALPTTSNNGITGTWAPALNNTTTTTYTFTPVSGQCATAANLTITVNPNITPTFTSVPAICSGANLSALPTTSNNGITGTWAPGLNNTTTTTYTFTPVSGQCATATNLTITVNPNITPTFTSVPEICSGENLNTLPTTSNNGITGTWAPALNNTTTTTYTFTPITPLPGQCATTANLTINVRDDDATLYLPNVFTPTGDGLNDIFIPLRTGIVTYNMKVFNRWGEMIFETDDLDTGWDGRYKGIFVQDGVYVWIINYRTNCTGNKYLRKIGHITLYK
jgi:gliding motility-associated-like protein